MQQTWFITGISSGLGKAIAHSALEQGHQVIGTFRNKEQADAFTQAHQPQGLGLVMDITDSAQISAAVDKVSTLFGKIDVLVNNAGFGFAGAIEEASDTETRAVMEANFFGALAVTRAFLPILRSQGSGHIIQISSHGGFKGFPGFGIYNAAKFALEGFSEALAAELAPLGIQLTIVEPGPFRTAFAGSSFAEASRKIPDYDTTAGAFRQRMQDVNGKQDGDPAKAAAAIMKITQLAKPPLRLPLGKIAIATLRSKIDMVNADILAHEALSLSTSYDG